ncbi:putative ras-like small GTPase [Leptomonas seymouri]|uniref:Putative ras-like small GTPase n=1 Tax=Leptomonas seymouri TaxID=5684 RepID=A0A0N1HTB6_LEPSE|nr:putative ras-like small GTPase [Leptomonas seymouri]|eukprot:KPI83045.1 putative ras-like small GTPase [Leptomonas seymouri]
MNSSGAGRGLGDDDDFTYTEDESGAQRRVAVEREYVFKVVVVGDYSVGKTSLIKRMLAVRSLAPSSPHHEDSDIEDSGDDDVLGGVAPTVGTDFYSLSFPQVLPGTSLRLQLWDTAGLAKYAARYESTFRNASFVICVFDVTSARSLHDVVDRHLSIAAEHIPELDQSSIMVVANKIDILHDMDNNTTALRDARKRAQSPETAFAGVNDDDTETSTALPTSARGIDKDAIVTAKNVQAEVFDLFNEVHYAEVSAKTRQNVRSMLQRVVFALLRNCPEASACVDVPEAESTNEAFAHTVLPRQLPGSAPTSAVHQGVRGGTNNSLPVAMVPELSTSSSTPLLNSRACPSSLGAKRDENGPLPSSTPRPDAAASAAALPAPPRTATSWGATGAFKFDMAPQPLEATTIFSPVEETAKEGSCRDDSLRNSLRSSDIPFAGAATVAGSSSVVNSRFSAVKPTEVLAELNAGKRAKPAPPDPNETPQARKEREQAEMSALLGRPTQRRDVPVCVAAASSNSTGAATVDTLRNDADKMEDDVATGRDQISDNRVCRPMTSILDSLGMQEGKKGGNRTDNGNGHRSDSDEDGARLQEHLKDRYAQIEHDIRQDNAVAKERAKRAKKAKGKCKCILM